MDVVKKSAASTVSPQSAAANAVHVPLHASACCTCSCRCCEVHLHLIAAAGHAVSRSCWGHDGSPWNHAGVILVSFGVILGQVGMILGSCWDHLEGMLAPQNIHHFSPTRLA